MGEKHMHQKIQETLAKEESISEPEVRSTMILVRKCLENLSESEKTPFLTLMLFCNWSAHIEITKSFTGLRILAAVNDALVKVKDSTDSDQMRYEISRPVGIETLRKELRTFLQKIQIANKLNQDHIWVSFLHHLLEIIRDVPLAFPPVEKLNNKQRKLYEQIAENPIKTGAGILSLNLSIVDYSKLHPNLKNSGERWCLILRSEDTTSLVVPLLISLN